MFDRRLLCGTALAILSAAPAALAQDIPAKLSARIAQGKAALEGLGGSDFVKGEVGNTRTQLNDADSNLQARRPYLTLETLSSAAASIDALTLAAVDWDAPGKGIDALESEWKKIGAVIGEEQRKFPARAPAGQPAFVRGIAELSLGQVSENYAAAVDYGRVNGIQFGAYYLGRARGHMAFALFSSGLTATGTRPLRKIPALAAEIAKVEKEILTAYAKPGSTAFHSSFIVANSSIKLARELESKGYRAGAMLMLMRAIYALGQTSHKAPAADELGALKVKAEEYAARFAASRHDESIGEQYVQKALVAIELGAASGEGAEPQRLRAALLLNFVLPKYMELMEGAK